MQLLGIIHKSNNMKKYIIFILLLLNSNLLFSANKKAFFLCADKKIYIIDLKKYSITNSESIPTLGKPTYVDIKKNIAYIGNERGYSEKSYFPLILVNLSNFKIMDTHNIVKDEKPHAIYFVKVSKKYK